MLATLVALTTERPAQAVTHTWKSLGDGDYTNATFTYAGWNGDSGTGAIGGDSVAINGDAIVELDETFAARLAGAIDRARALGLVTGTLQAGDLLRFPQALTVREDAAAPPEEELNGLRRAAEEGLTVALDALDGMRRQEGAMLQVDLDRRRAALADAIDRVEAAAADGQGALRTRLHERIQDLGGELTLEPAAVAQEVVRFVARSDIAEEVVRFRAHLAHMSGLLAAPEPCGRKLDFLIQEMNREVNTIGSKADGLQVPAIIVDMKSELERLREQVQNIE